MVSLGFAFFLNRTKRLDGTSKICFFLIKNIFFHLVALLAKPVNFVTFWQVHRDIEKIRAMFNKLLLYARCGFKDLRQAT